MIYNDEGYFCENWTLEKLKKEEKKFSDLIFVNQVYGSYDLEKYRKIITELHNRNDPNYLHILLTSEIPRD